MTRSYWMYPRLQREEVTKKARHRAGKKQCIIDFKEQICPGIFLALNGGYFVDYPSNIFATRGTKRYEQLTVYCVAHFSLFYTMALWTNEYVPSSVSSIRLELNLKQTFIVLDMRPKIGRYYLGNIFF